MAKSAQQAVEKYVSRASGASSDYVQGALSTTKDQAQAAIAAAENHKQATIEALNRGAYANGVRKAGVQAWRDGVQRKGANRYSEGISEGREKYVAESGRYDSARGAAASLPRGTKGSAANYDRSRAVGQALRALKVGGAK